MYVGGSCVCEDVCVHITLSLNDINMKKVSNFIYLWQCNSQRHSAKLSGQARELPKQGIIQLLQISSSTNAVSVPASAAPLTGLKDFFLVFHLYCKTVLHAPVLIWDWKLSLRFRDSVKAGLVLTSQQSNVNLPDKVLQRWALLPGTESSLHLKGNSLFFC